MEAYGCCPTVAAVSIRMGGVRDVWIEAYGHCSTITAAPRQNGKQEGCVN